MTNRFNQSHLKFLKHLYDNTEQTPVRLLLPWTHRWANASQQQSSFIIEKCSVEVSHLNGQHRVLHCDRSRLFCDKSAADYDVSDKLITDDNGASILRQVLSLTSVISHSL